MGPEGSPPDDHKPADWPRLLGRKVSIRYVLHDDPEHPFSEAVGVVMATEDEMVSILTKKGTRVDVNVHDVQAMKVFPL